MSYKKLEIWQLARELSIEIHKMTLHFQNLNSLKKLSKSEGRQKQLEVVLWKDMAEEGIKQTL